MGRNITVDARIGGGDVREILFGEITIEPTSLRHDGSTTVLPVATRVGLSNGKATMLNIAVSPDGPEPDWAYKVTLKDHINHRAWSEIVGVPDGTTSIAYSRLPRFTTVIPGDVTSTQLQNWAAQTEANADRAEAAAQAAEAPTDTMNKNLISNQESQTRAALDSAIIDMLGPVVADTPIVVRGHSYTIVPGAYVQPGQEWSSVLAAKLGTTRNSYGRSGARMIECAAMAIAPSVPGISGTNTHQPGTKALTIIECETNDALSGPATAQGRLGFEHALRALLATVTASKRIESNASSVTTTGTWNNFTSNPIGSGGSTRYTAVNGNTLTFNDVEAPAGKAYILTFVHEQAEANIGSLTVEVDGVDQGITWNGGGKMQQFTSLVTSTGWPTYSHAVIPVNIPKTGAHTVKITKGGAASSAYVDALLIPGSVPPPVLVLKDPPVGGFTTQARQDAWAENSPYLHSIIDTVTSEFASARVVDLGPGWDYTTMASTDDSAKFHPNATGMRYIADSLTVPAVHRNLAHASAGAWA